MAPLRRSYLCIDTLVNIIFFLSFFFSLSPSLSICFFLHTACTTVGSQGIKKPKFDEVTMVYPKGYTGESPQIFSSVSLSPCLSLSLSFACFLLWTGLWKFAANKQGGESLPSRSLLWPCCCARSLSLSRSLVLYIFGWNFVCVC